MNMALNKCASLMAGGQVVKARNKIPKDFNFNIKF